VLPSIPNCLVLLETAVVKLFLRAAPMTTDNL